MIRLSDYLVGQLADWGVRHVFLVTGGGAMHLNDSIAKEKRIRYFCTHHEQAAAMAAEGYARVAGRTGVLNVTTGPGGINALNGVFGAWTDSVPLLVLSGQVKRETCMASYNLPGLRQLGDQESDIVRMAGGITKYCVLVHDPNTIRYHLERAWYLAATGRPGPCWLDIPVDVQSAQIDPASLPQYDPEEDPRPWLRRDLPALCSQVLSCLQQARRPVILAGSGVRIAGAIREFEEFIRLLRIPVTTAWTHDLIASDDELFCGRPGTIGDRAGNFTVQNADAVLVLGSRLNIRQVSYNWRSFAKEAFKIQVDVDAAELCKPSVRPDLPVHADLKAFLAESLRQIQAGDFAPRKYGRWLAWCRERVRRYPVVHEAQRSSPVVNPYHFIEVLFSLLDADDVVVCGNAAACITTYQVARLKKGQRLISNSGAASMGHDLPAAIGAAVAREGKRVICLAGDGSINLNLQELSTIAYHRLPIKVFVLNNGGYLSIRLTQSNFFGNLVGESPASGLAIPDFPAVAAAFGLSTSRIGDRDGLCKIPGILASPGPELCEVILDPAQEFEPRIRSRQLADGTISTPELDDMFPFLEPQELEANRIRDWPSD